MYNSYGAFYGRFVFEVFWFVLRQNLMQSGLALTIALPPPPEQWDGRPAPAHSGYSDEDCTQSTLALGKHC